MRHHDLVILGAGTGNSLIDDRFSELDVAIVEENRFGGTCLNHGCIPSKMLAHVADVVRNVETADVFNVDAELRGVHWLDVRDRVFGRIDGVVEDGRLGRRDSDFISVYEGTARFIGPKRLLVRTRNGDVKVEADRIVVATGSRPAVPTVISESHIPFETSDTIMRIDAVPPRLAVLGGGYVAAELVEVFAAAGSDVVIIDSSDTLLGNQDELVAREFTELAGKRFSLRLGREVTAVRHDEDGVHLTLDDDSTVDADVLLVATGRVTNNDRLDLDRTGIGTREDGRIIADKYLRTTADGIFAIGDASSPVPLKHVANREAEVLAHNLLNPNDLRAVRYDSIPSAVFAHPQVASVGATEQKCRDDGLDYSIGLTRYSDIAHGWALENTTGFCKVLVERGTGKVLGAHLMGPQASALIQPLVIAITLGIDAATLVHEPYWIHPALTEVVDNALRAATD